MKTTRAFLALLLLTAFVSAATPASVAGTDEECDPDPIGRCGAYQREEVLFCFLIVNGQYVSATDADAIGVVGAQQHGVKTGLAQLDNPQYYLRTDSIEAFVADPYNAQAPSQYLWKEDNGVAGLQPTNFKCGMWVWYEECEPPQWMGPAGETPFLKDVMVA